MGSATGPPTQDETSLGWPCWHEEWTFCQTGSWIDRDWRVFCSGTAVLLRHSTRRPSHCSIKLWFSGKAYLQLIPAAVWSRSCWIQDVRSLRGLSGWWCGAGCAHCNSLIVWRSPFLLSIPKSQSMPFQLYLYVLSQPLCVLAIRVFQARKWREAGQKSLLSWFMLFMLLFVQVCLHVLKDQLVE